MTLRFGTASHQGSRPYQEDTVAATERVVDRSGRLPLLTVIADGMGGHAAGDVASVLAARSFVARWEAEAGNPERLLDALDAANEAIAGEVARHPVRQGMGTTIVALELSPDTSFCRWLSVGDSLLVRIGSDGLRRLNADHSYRADIARAEAEGEDPEPGIAPNMLRSAVMGGHVPLVDHFEGWQPIPPGSVFILASDGLETLSEAQVAAIVTAGTDAQAIARELVDAVIAAGRPKQDNVTVAVLLPDPDPAAASPTEAPPRLPSVRSGRAGEPASRPPAAAPEGAIKAMAPAEAQTAGLGRRTGGMAGLALALLAGIGLGGLGGFAIGQRKPEPQPVPPAASAPASAPAPQPVPTGPAVRELEPAIETAKVEQPAPAQRPQRSSSGRERAEAEAPSRSGSKQAASKQATSKAGAAPGAGEAEPAASREKQTAAASKAGADEKAGADSAKARPVPPSTASEQAGAGSRKAEKGDRPAPGSTRPGDGEPAETPQRPVPLGPKPLMPRTVEPAAGEVRDP